jgi:hypothetical protein
MLWAFAIPIVLLLTIWWVGMNFASRTSLSRFAIIGLLLWGLILVFDALATRAILGDNLTYRVILGAFGLASLIAGAISAISYKLSVSRANASKSKEL